MERVEKDYEAFKALLALVKIKPLGKPILYKYDGDCDTGCQEMALKPTKEHLKKLIKHLAGKPCEALRTIIGDDKKIAKLSENRKRLFFGSAEERNAACEKALNELEKNYEKFTPSHIPWYVFEGFTKPDIFIEGEDYVIVCEGKWTEGNITTTTTFLCDTVPSKNPGESNREYRNQMTRHIQAALDCYKGKRVYAFYIVEEGCKYEKELAKKKYGAELKKETIPLSEEEKEQILGAYCGYTTWKKITKKIENIVFLSKEDIRNSSAATKCGTGKKI